MKIVIFGLSVTSAWGNGHATLLRGLFRALHNKGHQIHFFERDTPYYAPHRDAPTLPYAHVHLYDDWQEIKAEAATELKDADLGIVTSYCPDGVAACNLVLNSNLWRSVFYDMDTPVTLSRLEKGETVEYLPPNGLGEFDLVLSYTGGRALDQLREKLGAQQVETLYGWVDPVIHHQVDPSPKFQSNLSYLGTYAADRQATLEQLLISPARALRNRQFVIGGAMYANRESWPGNIRFFDHVAPPEHCAFYSSSPLTLNITRGSMAAMGYCPSGRLFEAAACGTAVLSDWWEGLDIFFEPGEEILIAQSTAEAIDAVSRDSQALRRIGKRAKEKALDCHAAENRAQRLLSLLEGLPQQTSNTTDAMLQESGV
ncbi:MAG: glycosyltransferase [Acidobacteriaceae bacterium]|nr:glycosyltransferase [Acidobacteriaceae bacterium]MBV9038483.1 glycosyltransferase [Acidobacteriaceae bacterium]MBV9937889.1 glycosyltransferase [Acidobacteriaceae bacterium]